MDNWLHFITAMLSGGVVVKFMEFLCQTLISNLKRKRTSKEIVDKHLDPLMKAADEIVGKTISLAKRDFKDLIESSNSKVSLNNSISNEMLGLLYLYAQFWGRIEILKQESLGVSISGDKRGKKLKGFLACMESQKIRLIDRTHQKAIGELAINLDNNGKFRPIGLVEFKSKLSHEEVITDWFTPLLDILKNLKEKKVRQKVLVYGVVAHALIDTLDQKRHSTHYRDSYPNKLSKQSLKDVKYRVLGEYLKDVKNTGKYIDISQVSGTPQSALSWQAKASWFVGIPSEVWRILRSWIQCYRQQQ